MSTLTGFDWTIVAVYFAGLVGIVYWSSQRQKTTSDYFLAGRHAAWFVVGASLFASNIGSEHIVGLAGNGATSGMAMAHWELHAWVMIVLAWVFVPFYYKSGVFTMPEFLERRFDARTRWVLSIVSLIAYVFTKVSVTVYAGALVFKTLLPDTFGSPDNAFWVGAFTTVVLTGIYTVMGGLRAVLYTEVAQAFILLIGSVFITYIGLSQLGGWGELQALCKENAESFALWRPLSDPDFPWLGILIASPVIGVWYWCTDQYIIQRTLASKSLKDARRGALFGGLLKVWPVMIFLVPGLIGWALHQKGLMVIPSKGEGQIDGDQVFATMVTNLLPVGMRGLVVAGLLSALMSSLASLFNSCATLFTIDIYEKIRPGMSEKHLVRVGRLATVVVVVCGIVWIPIMHNMAGGGLYKYLQSVQGYLAPPITAVFLLGLFWKRCTKVGAFWGLIIGFVLGMGKMVIEAVVASDAAASGVLVQIAEINFLYYSGVLLVISLVLVVALSLVSEKPDPASIQGLTRSTLSEADKREIRESWDKWDIVMTTVLLVLVVGMYTYFSFWLS
ncbi:sodium:solute symporter [Pelagicoccus mobilis]|uniref:Sodium:solute symporter n=1 Tax=Pelagicoccus mobilis TaxID=415221 RepID=A0A934VM13_9BACT|nr:sodium:solute symporter [Pelagicoccus mobilis]MBK1878361.1 sodium:solute symporter [Pelagicoccus mobilis]